MTRQFIQGLYSPHILNTRNQELIYGEVEIDNKTFIYIDGKECTTATRANSIEGWVELLVIINIKDGLPTFATLEGNVIRTIIYGDVKIIKINGGE